MSGNFYLLADTASRTTFELGRDLSSPLDWILPVIVVLVLAWFVIGMYVLDCVELGGRFATLLISLRLIALLGLLAVYLQPQWRAERDVVDRSRVLVLVDTSQSMGRRDVTATEGGGTTDDVESRIDRVVRELDKGELLGALRKTHDAIVYRFDEEDQPPAVASLAYIPAKDKSESLGADEQAAQAVVIRESRWRLGGAVAALALALVLLVWYLLRPATTGARGAGPLVAAGGALAVAIGVAIWGFSGAPQVPLSALLGTEALFATSDSDDARPDDESKDESETIAWQEQLVAQGGDSKLGQAVYQLIADQRSTPLAAVVLLSDGQRTAGLQVEEAADFAAESDVAVYTIGLGSLQSPEFVRVSDYAAPARAYRGDPLEVMAYVQSQGLAGRGAVVTLRQLADGEASQQDGEDTGIVYDVETTLGTDEEDVTPVNFPIEAFEEPGRYGFELSVSLKGARAQDEDDARQRFYIDVVDRDTKVLLLSGGPSREYQFLRNLLKRDKHIELDVMLQSKRFDKGDDPGYLSKFPSDRDEIAEYDCIVAIDPAWSQLGPAAAALVENWVGEEAGGLIVIPGSVHAGSIVRTWIYDDDYQQLRDLYPVDFHSQFEGTRDRQQGSKSAWPVELTRAGMEAEFLRLDDNPAESNRLWARFPGIYGGYPVKGKKYGATVYAHFGDTMAETQGYDPIYFAGHFYGNGRVFYLGSGEMWRIRQLDDSYFEQLYTRVIRHVSTGRLLRGSSRGDVLLLEKTEYQVGDTVPVVAHLKNAQRDPLSADSVPLFIFDPSGKSVSLLLKPDPVRAGTYRGQFTVRRPQDYRLELQLPESDDEVLSKIIRVTTSAREDLKPQQNAQALKLLAETSGGRYYASIEAALGQQDDPPLVPSLEDQTRVTPVAGDIDPVFKAAWSKWMMFALCGILCIEWLLRRLFKLA